MKKIWALLLGLIIISVLTSGFSLKEFRENIRLEAKKSFEDLFQGPVSIKRAHLFMGYKIVLEEVKIAPFAHAEKVYINFNPLKYALHKGDIFPAITKIMIEEGYLEIERDKKGNVNALELLRGGGGGNGGAPFKSNIYIKKSFIKYTDKAGFGFGPTQFSLKHAAGVIDLTKKDSIYLNLAAAGARLQGKINLLNNEVEFKAKISDLNVPPFKNLSGEIFWKNNKVIFKKLKGRYEKLEFLASGAAFPLLDLNLEFAGEFFSQSLSGKANLNIQGSQLNLNFESLEMYSGTLKGSSQIYLAKKPVAFTANLSAQNVNLSALTQKIPGFRGQLNGKITLNGDLEEFKTIIKGDLENASFFEQPLDKGEIHFSLKNGKFSLDKLNLKSKQIAIESTAQFKEDATFNLQGKIESKKSLINFSGSGGSKKTDLLNFTAIGYLELAEIAILKRYGRISGLLNLEKCSIRGTPAHPLLTFKLEGDNLTFNGVDFDKLSAYLKLETDTLTFIEPFYLVHKENLYQLEGNIKVKKVPVFDLEIKTRKAELTQLLFLARLIESISKPQAADQQIKIKSTHISTPGFPGQKSIYQTNGKKDFVLNFFSKIFEEIKARQIVPQIGPLKGMEGILSGDLSLKGPLNQLAAVFYFSLSNGKWENYKFDSLEAEGNFKGEYLDIKNLVLKKEGGRLTAAGKVGLKDKSSLEISATNMPVNIFSLIFKEEKELYGHFDAKGYFEGTLASPVLKLNFKGRDIGARKVHFDKINASLSFNNQILEIKKLSIIKGEEIGIISGTYSLNPGYPSDFRIDLKDEALGFINLFTEEIDWKDGKGSFYLTLKGKTASPSISGAIDLKKSLIFVKALEGNLDILEGNFEIGDNQLKIGKFRGYWIGKTTHWHYNPFSIIGTINLAELLAEGWVNLNLSLADCDWNINFKDLYSGKVEIRNLSLTGPYPVLRPTAKKSNLAATLNFNDGIIYLPKSGGEKTLFPSLALNLTANLIKNVYITGGEIVSIDITNILINLEAQGDNLQIAGTLNNPSVFGKVNFKYGTINILNRDLELMTLEKQNAFYHYDLDKVENNTADFKGKGTIPVLNLTAQTNIVDIKENASSSGTMETEKEEIIIIARVKGKPILAEKGEALSLKLEAYKKDASKFPAEIVSSNYSEDQIKLLLLPDYIKIPLGLSKKGWGSADTDIIIENYLNSRVQTLVFRGIERKLEQILGLESLTLQYNFGKGIKQVLAFDEASAADEEEIAWGFGFVKGFFDKLYLNVRYSEGIETVAGVPESIVNYQLTYKLTKFWSIVYLMEPTIYTDISSLYDGYYQLMLKGGFQF